MIVLYVRTGGGDFFFSFIAFIVRSIIHLSSRSHLVLTRNIIIYHLFSFICCRYCVLWAYGGFYIDDDSSISDPLTDIVKVNDTLILSSEKRKYSECYLSHYKLSRKQLNMLKPDENNNSNNSNNNNKKPLLQDRLDLFDHATVNWALFSQPGNLVIENVLRNIVNIYKMEYLKRPVFKIKHHDMRALQVICSTGKLLTQSVNWPVS